MDQLMRRLTLVMFIAMSNLSWAGADTGFYIGGGIGLADIDLNTANLDFDDDDAAYKAIAGYNFGWVPLVDIGFEVAYTDFGEVSQTLLGNESRFSLTGISALAMAGIKTGPVGFFAKAGVFSWDSESEFLGSETDDSGDDLAYGIGVRFQLFSAAIRAEIERFDIDDVDINYLSASAIWTF